MPKVRRGSEGASDPVVARLEAQIDLLPGEPGMGETAAYDVVIDGLGLAGRWVRRAEGGSCVTWRDGGTFETGIGDLTSKEIVAAVRSSMPLPEPERAGPRFSVARLVRALKGWS